MSSFQIEYYLDIPIGVNSTKFEPMNTVAPPLKASNPVLECQVNEQSLVVNQDTSFTITVSLIDSISSQIVPNIAWKVRNSFISVIKSLFSFKKIECLELYMESCSVDA
jgi:hypothetical protein